MAQASGVAEGNGSDGPDVTAWLVDTPLEKDQLYYWRAWAFDGALDGDPMEPIRFFAGRFPGDFDGDLVVDFADWLLFVEHYNAREGEERYRPDIDMGGNARIDFEDFVRFVQLFRTDYSESVSPKPALTSARQIAEDGALRVWMAAEVDRPKAGQTFVVDVNLTGETGPFGYGLELRYDDVRVQFTEATAPDDAGEPFGVLKEEPGRIWLGGKTSGKQEAEVDAVGLVRLHFQFLTDVGIGTGSLVDTKDLLIKAPGDPIRRIVGLQGLSLKPGSCALDVGYPNPFNASTVIPFAVAEEGRVTIRVYNVLGQQTATLISELHPPGFYRVVWDGRDDHGRLVASGVYLVRMTAPDFTQVRKLMLLK